MVEDLKSIATQNNGQIDFKSIRSHRLTNNQKSVLWLITHCVETAKVLNEHMLQDWFMEHIVKKRKKIKRTRYLGLDERGWEKWEREEEYAVLSKNIQKNNGILDYWYLSEAKQILKMCIGALVVKGILTVIPNININDIPENNQISNGK